jgi:type I restriction enzyme S subunit
MSSNEWVEYKLGDICTDISYGYTASADWEIEGPKFLRITDIQDYFINWNTVPQCPISESDRKKYLLEIGDIVIARTGASTGSTFTLKDEVDAVFASYLIRYKIDNNIANPFYIGYLLKSSKWKEYVSSIIGGSAQPGANAKQFADFNFILPDKSIQGKIVDLLSAIDEKIENNLATNQTLEEISRTLFKEWFVSFNYPDVDGNLKHSEFGEIPESWSINGIGVICYVQNGYALRAKIFKSRVKLASSKSKTSVGM